MSDAAWPAAMISFALAFFLMEAFVRMFGIDTPLRLALFASWMLTIFVPLWQFWETQEVAGDKIRRLEDRNKQLAVEIADLRDELKRTQAQT